MQIKQTGGEGDVKLKINLALPNIYILSAGSVRK